MIFGEIRLQERYDEAHEGLVSHLSLHFPHIRSGLQGDSWIWIFDGDERVEIDTFASMHHEIKAARGGAHVRAVLEVLALVYEVSVHPIPLLEPHEVPQP